MITEERLAEIKEIRDSLWIDIGVTWPKRAKKIVDELLAEIERLGSEICHHCASTWTDCKLYKDYDDWQENGPL